MRIVHPNASTRIKKVVADYVNFVSKSYGPAGKSVLIQEEHRLRAVDDGKIISDRYELEDETDNAVVGYIKEATAKTDSRVGDGTTTAAIIMGAIVAEALEEGNLYDKKNPQKHVKGIQDGVKEAITQIKKASKVVKTEEELYDIALNSSNDEELAEVISSTVFSVGKDGIVAVQDSQTAMTIVEKVDGMEIEKGYASPYLINEGQDKVHLKNPYILLANKKLESFQTEVFPLYDKLVKEARASKTEVRGIVIIADGFSEDVILNTVVGKSTGYIRPLLIENPAFGEHKLEFLKDLQAVCGGSVLDPKLGESVGNVTLESLGSVKSIVSTKTNTILINSGNKKAIAERVETLKTKDATTDYEKDKILRRIAALQGGIAVIKVGANTSNEQETKKLKVEDAVNATRLAFKNGSVRGGGVTLDAITTSSEVLNKALKAPRLKLIENGEEFLDDKVYDPVDVLIAALESGASIALGLIQISGIIATKREKKEDKAY